MLKVVGRAPAGGDINFTSNQEILR